MEVNSRTRNSLINSGANLGIKGLTIILSYAVRVVFIRMLGAQYAGISGLFTDILTLLSFAELGIGSAIIYALYKPIAENDQNKIAMLMRFYRNAYRVIALVILAAGLCLIPFLNYIVKGVPDIVEDIRLLYTLYIVNASVSYLFIYRATLLMANQREYITIKIKAVIMLIKTIVEIILLLVFKNFLVYLCFSISVNIIQNILISQKAKRSFPALEEKNARKLPDGDRKRIGADIRALMLFKITEALLNGTDSSIISAFLGTEVVGVVYNYNLIISQLYGFIFQIANAITASIGNLIATETKEHQYEVFRTLMFLTFWIYCFSSSCMWTLFTPFIELSFGKNYVLPDVVVALMILWFYLRGNISPVFSFRTSSGLFKQGKWRWIAMTLINITVSILLVKVIGLAGVVIGTIVSMLTTEFWYDPLLVFRKVFERPISEYIKSYALYFAITLICSIFTRWLCSWILCPSLFVTFLLKAILAVIIPNIILFILFSKTKEFRRLAIIAMSMKNT